MAKDTRRTGRFMERSMAAGPPIRVDVRLARAPLKCAPTATARVMRSKKRAIHGAAARAAGGRGPGRCGVEARREGDVRAWEKAVAEADRVRISRGTVSSAESGSERGPRQDGHARE